MFSEETTTIEITARYNQERTHRYLIKRKFNEGKPEKSATILMLNASNVSNLLHGDLTGMVVQNNLSALDFTEINIVNLFSLMQNKADLSGDLDSMTNETNTEVILECAKNSDVFVVAVGTVCRTYRKVAVVQDKLFERLRAAGLQSKVHTVEARDGTQGLHPISPKLREPGSWRLVPFALPEPPKSTPEQSQADTPDASSQGQKTEKKAKK